MEIKNFTVKTVAALSLAIFATGCSSVGNALNPFYESPKPVALLGEPNDHALEEGDGKSERARQAMETMASYQRAHDPQPNNPVIQPAVVRLMWVPDHLNKHGDLVPSHYYYLKVLKDRWAVTDAFELEAQLKTGGSGDSSVPFVPADEVKGK